MATIKDIARLAGVSHGTVSNVLNSRGNVSVAKIDAVMAAAAKLGYRANNQAKLLRGGNSTSVALILPDIQHEKYHLLYNGLSHFLFKQNCTLELFLTYDSEENEKRQLALLASRQYMGVIAVTTLTNAEYYYKELSITEDNVIFVYRKPVKARKFFDVDMAGAAEHLAGVVRQKAYKTVSVLTDNHPPGGSAEFNAHLQTALSQDVQLKYFYSSGTERHKASFELASAPRPDAIICIDYDCVRQVRNAFHLGSCADCPPLLALTGEELRLEPNLYSYAMNYQELGKKIGQIVIRHPEHGHLPEPALNDSYRSVELSANSVPARHSLNLLTIPSPSTDALEKLLPHFFRLSGIDVNLVRIPFNQLIATARKPEKAGDLIRIDMAALPSVAEEIFTPLSELPVNLLPLLQNFPQHIVQRYSYIADTPYVMPFDPSIQMLFYRRDLFEDHKIRRLYYEQYRREMTIPKDFEEYDRLSEFFTRLAQQDETGIKGACATVGGVETLATEFLLRYYAKGGRLFNNNLPGLTPEIAVSALQSYFNSLDNSLCLSSNWWHDSVTRFERGELAMLIVYINLFSDVAHSQMAPLIGYAAVPGGTPLLGGGCIGVSRYSEKQALAGDFLQWLFSPTITEQLVLLGGSSASVLQYQNPKIREAYPWLKMAKYSSACGIRESYIFDGTSFNLYRAENIIGKSIFKAIKGGRDEEETIKEINRELAKLV